jgi:hypothetical protein
MNIAAGIRWNRKMLLRQLMDGKGTAIMGVPMLPVQATLIVRPEVSLFLPRSIAPEMLR